jgi:uncharacterized coiled-coil DUF342 family protein
VKCDRQLFEKLKALKADELAEKTKNYLTKDEMNSVTARRDKIVARFNPYRRKRRTGNPLLAAPPAPYRERCDRVRELQA